MKNDKLVGFMHSFKNRNRPVELGTSTWSGSIHPFNWKWQKLIKNWLNQLKIGETDWLIDSPVKKILQRALVVEEEEEKEVGGRVMGGCRR